MISCRQQLKISKGYSHEWGGGRTAQRIGIQASNQDVLVGKSCYLETRQRNDKAIVGSCEQLYRLIKALINRGAWMHRADLSKIKRLVEKIQ